jgi:hypothetical protein
MQSVTIIYFLGHPHTRFLGQAVNRLCTGWGKTPVFLHTIDTPDSGNCFCEALQTTNYIIESYEFQGLKPLTSLTLRPLALRPPATVGLHAQQRLTIMVYMFNL